MSCVRRSLGFPWPCNSFPVLLPLVFVLRRCHVPDTADVQSFNRQNNNGITETCDRQTGNRENSLQNLSVRIGQNPPHFSAINSCTETMGNHTVVISPAFCNPEQTPVPAKVKVQGVRICISHKKEGTMKRLIMSGQQKKNEQLKKWRRM